MGGARKRSRRIAMVLLSSSCNDRRAVRFPISACIWAAALSGLIATTPALAAGETAAPTDATVDGGTGGPFEAIDASAGDPQFKALFQSWSRSDNASQGVMAVPSRKPVAEMAFSSMYGVRSDPFRGGAAMHAGVDIPGPTGTEVYATADGMVERAGWNGGYGNLVELNHGRGVQTRYGHLSRILVAPGARVKRGQLIARVGSTGRSTGPHLHYEVRLDGRAVNPMPFLQSADYVLAVRERTGSSALALGGPAE